MADAQKPTVGDELPPMVIEIGAQPMKTVAALLRDPVPMHFDASVAESMGLGNKTINQGPLNASYLIEMVTRFAGGPEAVRSVDVQFLGLVVADDTLTCSGKVVEVDDAAGTASLELEAKVGDRQVLSGTAVVAL
jgi:acyl dehydratase